MSLRFLFRVVSLPAASTECEPQRTVTKIHCLPGECHQGRKQGGRGPQECPKTRLKVCSRLGSKWAGQISVVTNIGVSFIAIPTDRALNSLQGVSHPNVIAVLAAALPVATNAPIPQASKRRLRKGACCSLVNAAAAGLELTTPRRLRAPPRPPLLHAASGCAGQEPHRGHRARFGSGLVPPLL